MTISFRCPQCQSPCTAPPEMAGRKAQWLKCTQVIVVPNPERDRWPPGMEPPGATHSSAAPAAQQASPPKKPQAASPPATRPAAVKPAAAQQGAGSPPRAQPVAKPVSPAQPIVAAPLINVQPQAAPAIPVAKAVPVVPVASATQPVPKPAIPPVAETVSEDLDALLEFEMAAPALPSAKVPSDNPYQSPQMSSTPAAPPSSKKRVSFGDILQTTGSIYKRNWSACLAGSVIAVVGTVVVAFLINLAVAGLAKVVVHFQLQSPALAITVVTAMLTSHLLAILFFSMGMLNFLLPIARGGKPDFSRLFGVIEVLFPALGLTLVVVAAILAGSILLVIPGLLAACLFSLAPIALLDREEGVFAALAESARLVSANLLMIFLLIFTVGLSASIISAFTLGLGALVTMPFQMLLTIVIYLRSRGSRTAVD